MAAKRGRKPQGAYSDKSAVLTTRITKELRAKLEGARMEHPRTWSLSQEVEDRLRKSFDEESIAEQKFGDRETYAIARLIAEVMNQVQMLTQRHWASSAFTVDACAQAIGNVLRAFALDDDAKAPKHLSKHFRTAGAAGDAVAGGAAVPVLDTGLPACIIVIDKEDARPLIFLPAS